MQMNINGLLAIPLAIIAIWGIGYGEGQFPDKKSFPTMRWCTVNSEEQEKCEKIALAINPESFNPYGRFIDNYHVSCTQSHNKDDCMVMIDNDKADITLLDPGELFLGGRYHSLVPIAYEVYRTGDSGSSDMNAVAVVRKNSDIRQLSDIRGKQACFGNVGTFASWVTPIHKLMEKGGLKIVDCNNHVKSALDYFGKSCAVNSLSDKYNPLGDNSHRLCEICGSDLPGVRCTSNDPYAGHEGALKCLMDRGDIAFVQHPTISEFFNGNKYYNEAPKEPKLPFRPDSSENDNQRNYKPPPPRSRQPTNPFNSFNPFTTTTSRPPFLSRNPFDSGRNRDRNLPPFGRREKRQFKNYEFSLRDEDELLEKQKPKGPQTLREFEQEYELLCEDGSRRSINDWRNCNWKRIPAHVLVTSSAKTSEIRRHYQELTKNVFDKWNQNRLKLMKMSNRSNLLFQDAAFDVNYVQESDQTYTNYLGEHMKSIMEIRSCPVGRVTLCVTSQPEMQKCIKMRTALSAQLLKPEMSCYRARSHVDCMKHIRKGNADFAVFDAGDVYTAGHHYGMIPVLSEVYNTQSKELGQPEYYAVAVAYQGDSDTELTYLKGKYSCHSGIGHAAGWILPLAYLISSRRMRNYGCDSVMAASQYFTKSCVPGALSPEYNFGRYHYNLCDLCRGSGSSYCRRDASEDFYGFTGAFRCLIEGGGQVAFVKHTTVSEIADGKRRETWARNTLSGDYELLCRDGTRAPIGEYKSCNLGTVKANAVMVRGGEGYNETDTKAIMNLLLYSQQFYGRKLEDYFSFGMFHSNPPYSDLIFQDAAHRLQVVPTNQRNFRDYLGKNFLKARALVDCFASGKRLQITNSLLSTLLLSTFLYYFINV